MNILIKQVCVLWAIIPFVYVAVTSAPIFTTLVISFSAIEEIVY